MKIIGIDTGSKGAIAEIDTKEKIVRWMKLPYREDGILSSSGIFEQFDFGEADKIGVEEVGYIKNARGSATFTFGKNFGMAMALLERYSYEIVRPQAWHKRINGSKIPDETRTTKDRSKASFQRMNPDFGRIVKSHHEGMIDAFFIAYFCGLRGGVVMPNGFTFYEIEV